MADSSIPAKHAEWLAFIRTLRAQLAHLGPLVVRERVVAEPTIRPEDTLLEADISDRRQASYQRRLSSLLAGRQ